MLDRYRDEFEEVNGKNTSSHVESQPKCLSKDDFISLALTLMISKLTFTHIYDCESFVTLETLDSIFKGMNVWMYEIL